MMLLGLWVEIVIDCRFGRVEIVRVGVGVGVVINTIRPKKRKHSTTKWVVLYGDFTNDLLWCKNGKLTRAQPLVDSHLKNY